MSDDLANDNRKPLPEHWKLRTGLPQAHHDEGALLPPLVKKALPPGPVELSLPAVEREIDLSAHSPTPIIAPIATPVIAPVAAVAAVAAPASIVSIAPVFTVPVIAPPPILESTAVYVAPIVVAAPAPIITPPKEKQVMPVPRMFKGAIDHPIARAPQVIPFATKTPTLFKSVSAVYTQPLGRADEWLPWMRTSMWSTANVAKRVSDLDAHTAHAGLPAIISKQVPPPSNLSFQKIKPSVAHEKLSSLRVEDKEARNKNKFNFSAVEKLLSKPIEAQTLGLPQIKVPALPPVDINKLVDDAVAKKVAEVLAQREVEKVVEKPIEKIVERLESVPAPAKSAITGLIQDPGALKQAEEIRAVVIPIAEPAITPVIAPTQVAPLVVAPVIAPVPIPALAHKSADEILHEALAGLAKKAAVTSLEGRPVKMDIKMPAAAPVPAVTEVKVTPVQVGAPVVEPEPYVEPTPALASQETLAAIAASAVDSWDDLLFGLPISTNA